MIAEEPIRSRLKPNRLAILHTERDRIARQLAQLVICEADIRRDSPFEATTLASVVFRRQALETYLNQLDLDIDELITVRTGA